MKQFFTVLVLVAFTGSRSVTVGAQLSHNAPALSFATIHADIEPEEHTDAQEHAVAESLIEHEASLGSLRGMTTVSSEGIRDKVEDAGIPLSLTALPLGSGFAPAFLSSFLVILLSEIGDKTFFIAAVLAMRYPRRTVFAGAISALALMTILSAAMGYAVPALLPVWATHWAAVALFFVFGFQLLKDALLSSSGQANAEYEEAVAEVSKEQFEDDSPTPRKLAASYDDDSQHTGLVRLSSLRDLVSPVFFKTLSLTFVAEWGDRSQISTIVLATQKNPLGVSLGGVAGHAICSCAAVIFGRILADWISERAINIAGGVLFLCFALSAAYTGP